MTEIMVGADVRQILGKPHRIGRTGKVTRLSHETLGGDRIAMIRDSRGVMWSCYTRQLEILPVK